MEKIFFYNTKPVMGGGQKLFNLILQNLNLNKEKKLKIFYEDNYEELNSVEKYIPQNIEYQFLNKVFISRKVRKCKNLYLMRVLSFIAKYLAFLKFFRIVKKEKPKIIVCYATYSLYFISKIRNKDIKKIAWLHGSIEDLFGIFKNIRLKKFHKTLLRYDYIIVICDEMKKQLLQYYPDLEKKVKVIYNSVDIEEIRKLAEIKTEIIEKEKELLKMKYIVSVGRLNENQKDFTTLIKAFKILTDKEKNIKLILVGTGVDEVNLKNLAKNLNIENKVFFIGEKINPYIWIKNAEIFVMSSKYEGFGIVLIEAMALNIPIIATSCKTGPTEILSNGKGGKLVSVGDIQLLADGMEELLTNKNLREKFLKESKIKLNDYDIKLNIKKIEKLLME